MKQSHYTTPRTLGECQFSPSMDPITCYRAEGYSTAWWASMIVCAVIALVAVWVTR